MIIGNGARGPLVRKLQEELKKRGFHSIEVDGIYGSDTKEAVMAFQKSEGFPADGIAGPQLFRSLGVTASGENADVKTPGRSTQATTKPFGQGAKDREPNRKKQRNVASRQRAVEDVSNWMPTQEAITDRQPLRELRRQLIATMSDEDLRTLCFDLGVDYENLAGDNKPAKARELVIYCERTGNLRELTALCRALRPKLTWNEP